MQVELNTDFYNEIQDHYHKSITADTYHLADINCYAFISTGREDKTIPSGQRIFEFVKPNGYPVYSPIAEDVQQHILFDTSEFAFIKDGMKIKHSQETLELTNCSCEDSSC